MLHQFYQYLHSLMLLIYLQIVEHPFILQINLLLLLCNYRQLGLQYLFLIYPCRVL